MKPPLSAFSTAFLAIALGTLSYAVLDKPTNPPKDLSFGRDVHPILPRHCLTMHPYHREVLHPLMGQDPANDRAVLLNRSRSTE